MSVKMFNLIDGEKGVAVRRCECMTVPIFIDNSPTKNGYTIRCPNCGREITSHISERDAAIMWNIPAKGCKHRWYG